MTSVAMNEISSIGTTANAGVTMTSSDIVEFLIWAAKRNLWLCEPEDQGIIMQPTTRLIHDIVNEFYASRMVASDGATR